mgnify:CR=1 FL=1
MNQETSLFKVLSDPTRLRLTLLLLANGETCVCRLAEALKASDSKISRHLGVMRAAGLAEARREGTWMYYTLLAPRSTFEESFYECLKKGLADSPTVREDLANLAKASCTRSSSQKDEREKHL